MKTEIEYKFLVDKTKLPDNMHERFGRAEIKQGYLGFDPVVRVRINANYDSPYGPNGLYGFLVVKGPGAVSRLEFETKISPKDAMELFSLCNGIVLEKTRYFIPYKDELYWEIDFYKNFDLVVAELEVPSENYVFEKPDWIVEDVTYIKEFSNASFAKNGFPKKEN